MEGNGNWLHHSYMYMHAKLTVCICSVVVQKPLIYIANVFYSLFNVVLELCILYAIDDNYFHVILWWKFNELGMEFRCLINSHCNDKIWLIDIKISPYKVLFTLVSDIYESLS